MAHQHASGTRQPVAKSLRRGRRARPARALWPGTARVAGTHWPEGAIPASYRAVRLAQAW